jgi:uncharacterized protein (DUF1501 family)
MACNDAFQAQSVRIGHITRRGFLRVGGMTLAALAVADRLGWVLPEGTAEAAPGNQGGARRLVVLELNGGNDGLNTLIPYAVGRYYDMRARVGVEQARVLPLDKTWGLHPSLGRLHARARAGQVTFVHGVGVERIADLSHFSMQALWRAGDPEAALTGASGWAGRLVTTLGAVASPVGGLSIASAPSPLVLDADARTAAAADPYQGQFAFPDGQADALRKALAAMAQPDAADAPSLRTARHGLEGTFAIHDMCAGLGDPTRGYPASDLGRALAFTAQLLGSQPGLRVVHVPVPIDFDTHDNQPRRQAANLAAIDSALEAFMTDLQARGLAANTAVLATSEFGRRVAENGSLGTDHGGANTLFLIAPGLRSPIVGTPPALERLDDDGNLVPTLSYRDYLATAVEGWMGVPASAVLPGSRPINLWS